jgi:N-methylhydantoinase B/oxoprolinase/acetone carboxylase alpha subunit
MGGNVGIVYGGKTLSEAIEERDRVKEEVNGAQELAPLDLLDSDPTKLERLYWRLITAAQFGRDSSMLISASPSSIAGELLQTIATPEGDGVAASWGLCGHSGALRIMMRTMADAGYDEDPGGGGIVDGDIFSCNDPVLGTSQNNDMYTALPLFWEGELIGWIAASLHLVDVGSALMPGMALISPTVYTDGLIQPPLKTGQGWKQSKAWELQLRRGTRMGVLNILDDKMKLVGALMVRDRVLKTVEEFGPEYFTKGCKELIERDRRFIIDRIKAWEVPWTSKHPKTQLAMLKEVMGKAFPEAAHDYLLHEPATCVFELDGTVTPDFRGASSQALCSLNIYPGGYNLASYIDFPVLAGLPTISGATFNVSVDRRRTDKGSLFEPDRDDLGSVLGCCVALDVHANLGHGYAQARFARGFLEQSWLNEPLWGIASFEGRFGNGEPFSGADWSLVSNTPMGVAPWRDGIACVLGTGNAMGDIGEAEDHEFLAPVMMFVARGLCPDVMAHGKFRSAPAFNTGFLVRNAGGYTAFHYGGVHAGAGGCIVGLCGGYPALPYSVTLFAGSNAGELIERGVSLPRNVLEARAAVADGTLTVREIKDSADGSTDWVVEDGDLIYIAAEVGSSWGEPLDRKPSMVRDDLELGWVSQGVAESVYGVVAAWSGTEWIVDEDATSRAREAMRQRRKQRSIPVKEWWASEREKVLAGDMPELTRAMYKDCLGSEVFQDEFLDFWQLREIDYRDRI